MGQIYGKITIDIKAQPFVNLPHKCITQLVEAFHLIAENFNLTLDELQDIFKVSLQEIYCQTDDEFTQMTKVFFNLFDHNSVHIIDSFELLSVLIVSSDMNTREKIAKVIDLVNFEGKSEFTIHEVALAMRSCVSGMCKVADLTRPRNDFIDSISTLVFSAVVGENVIVEYNVDSSKKITLKELTESMMSLPEIRLWLDHFNDLDEIDTPKRCSELPDLDNTKQLFDDMCVEELQEPCAQWKDMIRLSSHHDVKENTCATVPQLGIKLDWIYGRNTKNLTSSNAFYLSDGSILYAAGVVAVKFHRNADGLGHQDFYMEHNHYISCMAVSSAPHTHHGTLVATSEFCQQPQVHIWSSKTLRILRCLSGFHSVGVQSIDFSPSQDLLLTMGMDTMHSVAIYKWKSNKILFTTQTARIALQCRFLQSNDKFGACGNGFLDVWERKEYNSSYERKRCLFGKRFKNQAVTCLEIWNDKILSGSRDGCIYIWEGRSCTTMLETRNKSSISALIVTKNDEVYAGTVDGLLLIFNGNLEFLVSFRVSSIVKGPTCIDSLSYNRTNTILVGTVTGELFEVNKSDGTLIKFITRSNAANGSFGLDYTSTMRCLELATTGKKGGLCLINTSDKSVIREADFEAPVTTISYNTKGDLIVIGLDKPHAGQLLVLNADDLSIVVKTRPCTKCLLDCKHSNDGIYMAVGSANHNIYIYDAINYNLMARATGHTSPVNHIDFGSSPECGSAISIRSNSLNNEIMFWKLNGKLTPPMSQRKTVFESCSCPISWDLRELQKSGDANKIEVCGISHVDSIIAVTNEKGEIRVFNFPIRNELCALKLKAHGGRVGNLKFSKDGVSLFTLGKYDNCLMQWQVMKHSNLCQGEAPSCLPNLPPSSKDLPSEKSSYSGDPMEAMDDGKYSNQWRKYIVQPSAYSPKKCSNPPMPSIMDWVQGYNGSFSNNLFFSVDDTLIYPVGKILIYYDIIREKQLHFTETKDVITSLAIHPSLKICAVANGVNSSEILCVDNETLKTIQILQGHKIAPISIMQFNQTGRLLATINTDDFSTLSIYDWETSSCTMKYMQTTIQDTHGIAFGIKEVLQFGQNFIRLWSIEISSVDFVDLYLDAEEMRSYHSAISFGDGYLVGADDGYLHKLIGGNFVLKIEACESRSSIITLSSCADFLISCSKNGSISIFDKGINSLLKMSGKDIGIVDNTLIRSVACTRNQRFAIGTERNEIYRFSVDSEGKIHRSEIIQGHCGQMMEGLAVSSVSSICATTSDDKFLRIWDVERLKLCKSLQLHTISKCCCFSSDGSMIALGYGSPRKKFASESPGKWEIVDFFSLKVLLEDRPTRKMITAIKWSENTLAVGSSDSKVYLYSVHISGNDKKNVTFLHVFDQHYAPIKHIDFSSNSRYLKVNCIYNLNFFDVENGSHIEDASLMRDVEWKTHSCPYSWEITGVWSECSNHIKVDCVDTCIKKEGKSLIVAGLSNGDLGLYHYPCVGLEIVSRSFGAHSGRVGGVHWVNEKTFISIGIVDKSLIKWRIHAPMQNDSNFEIDSDSKHHYFINESQRPESDKSHYHGWESERIKRPWIVNVVPPCNYTIKKEKTSLKLEMLGISGFDGNYLHSMSHNEFISIGGSNCFVHDLLNDTQRFFSGHREKISCLAETTTCRSLVASGESGRNPTIKLWDINTCIELGSLENGHGATIKHLAFTDNDHTLISIGAEFQHYVCIWKSLSGEWFDGKLFQKIQSGSSRPSFLLPLPECFAIGTVMSLVYWKYDVCGTPVPFKYQQIRDDDKTPLSCGIRYGSGIATGTINGDIYFWKIEQGLTSKVKAHESMLTCLKDSHAKLISGANDGTIIVWNKDMTKHMSFDLRKHPRYNGHSIHSISTSQTQEYNKLLIGSKGNGIFEISTRTSNIKCLKESHTAVRDCVFHPCALSIYATCDSSGVLRIWNMKGVPIKKRMETYYECNCLDWSHDGEEILVGCVVGDTRSSEPKTSCFLVDYETMSIKWRGNDCKDTVTLVKFSHQSEMFALASESFKIIVYDNKRRSNASLQPRLRVLSNIHKARIRSIDFSKDSYYIQTSSDDYEHIRLNTDDGEVMTLPSQLKNIEWSTYTCHFGWAVHGIWPPIADVSSSSAEPTFVNRSNDELSLVVGLSDGQIRLYPYPCPSGDDVHYHTKKVHTGKVSKCTFNSNSTLMISLCKEENHLVVWKLMVDNPSKYHCFV